MKKLFNNTSNRFYFSYVIISLIFILFAKTNASGQCTSTLTIRPNALVGKDALVSSYSADVNTNFGTGPDIDALTWSIGGGNAKFRSFIQFDLSAIPVNAMVTTAELSLYYNPTSGAASGVHSSLTHSNSSYLQKVTAPWNENSITWNNQPSTDTTDEVIVPQSIDPHQDYVIDVKNLIQEMIANPSSNYGMMLRVQTETPYCALLFASSDNADSTKWPRLLIDYYIPVGATITSSGISTLCPGDSILLNASPTGNNLTYQWFHNGTAIANATSSSYYATSAGNYFSVVADTCFPDTSNVIDISYKSNHSLVLQPDNVSGVDAKLSNYAPAINTNFGNDQDIDALAWTIAGDDVVFRSLIRFDLSTIPTNASIRNAELFLYNNPTSIAAAGTHSSLSHTNAAWLEKVIDPWAENTVTWNNQPTTDTTTRVTVPESIDPHQDYIIDITNLVQDMIANPTANYGMMIRSKIEIKYCALLFASSDYPNSALRPKLSIDYYEPINALITTNDSTDLCPGDSVVMTASPLGGGYNYQWYQNNLPIGGAASEFYTATDSGTYHCSVSDSCTSMNSNNITITINCFTGISSIGADANVSVYPNPSNTVFTLNTNFKNNTGYSLILRDVNGKIVEQEKRLRNYTSHNFGKNLATGIYFAEINSEHNHQIIRLIKK